MKITFIAVFNNQQIPWMSNNSCFSFPVCFTVWGLHSSGAVCHTAVDSERPALHSYPSRFVKLHVVSHHLGNLFKFVEFCDWTTVQPTTNKTNKLFRKPLKSRLEINSSTALDAYPSLRLSTPLIQCSYMYLLDCRHISAHS